MQAASGSGRVEVLRIPSSKALSGRRLFHYACLIYLASFFFLAWNINNDGIAAAYSDPVSRIRAQDEAVYVNSVITMNRNGDWLTPKVMGRLFFQKPPMMLWLAAISVKSLGLTLLAVRLPSLLLGALGVALVFAWGAREASPIAGLLASGLLLLDPVWHTLSRLAYTDVPVSAFSVLALFVVAGDPRLEHRSTRIVFALSTAAAVLSKSLAGLLPFIAITLQFFLGGGRRPRAMNVCSTVLVFGIAAAPWHLYQLAVHREWFWEDYVRQQILGVGLGGVNTGVFNRSSLFWIERLAQLDPVALGVGVLGVLLLWRRRPAGATGSLLLCWLSTIIAALWVFRAKNLPYLSLLLPPLCLFGAIQCDRALAGRRSLAAGSLAAALVIQALVVGSSGFFEAARPLDGAAAMRFYYALHRSNGLIAVNADDEFYSATLPLPLVRYAYIDPDGSILKAAPFYHSIGIAITSEEFRRLDTLASSFGERLRSVGGDVGAIGSSVSLASSEDLARLIRERPDVDFYVPRDVLSSLAPEDAHNVIPFSPARAFLLSPNGTSLPPGGRGVPSAW